MGIRWLKHMIRSRLEVEMMKNLQTFHLLNIEKILEYKI